MFCIKLSVWFSEKMSEKTHHDDMLFEMMKDCKTLPIFFDEIFGFLHRRTDFYHIATDESCPVGLPEGLAEKLVRHSLYKWKPTNTIEEPTLLAADEIPACTEEIVIETAGDFIDEPTIVPPTETFKDLVLTTKDHEFTSAECFNGSVFDNYSWSQNIGDVDVIVKVPENVTTKDLIVSILPSRISVRLKDDTVLLEGELCQKCKHNDAIWSLHRRKLDIHLDKCLDMWWDCLVKNEAKLDVSKIDCSRPFEELSEEAQAKIYELQWNQERKRLGLSTSNQIGMEEKLRKAWNAEGSPFSGPFDPSSVAFQ